MPNKNRLAARRNQKSKKRNLKKPFVILIIFVLFALIFSGLFILYIAGNAKYNRLTLAIAKDNGDVALVVYDSKSKSETSINIPGNVEVKAARQLGTWKLGSIFKIGQNEGGGGEILTLTITKSFKFPVTHWLEEKSGKTNLSLADKISLGVMSLQIPSSNKTKINLSETGYLRPKKLPSGEAGFIIKETMPDKLLTIFADPQVAAQGQNITILDGTDSPGVAKEVGKILEVLGGKVVSLKNENSPEIKDCQVKSKNREVGERIAQIFLCSTAPAADNNVQIILGKDFAVKF